MIPYGKQSIDENDIAAVVDVLRSDWLTTGPKIVEFEKNLLFMVKDGLFYFEGGFSALVISWYSQARAYAQYLSAVRRETPRTAAACSMVRPAK